MDGFGDPGEVGTSAAQEEAAEREAAEREAAEVEAAEREQDPFEALVWRAVDGLPGVFREQLGSVAIVIEDEPTADQAASVHATGLLGLYTGVPRTAYGAEHYAAVSKIVIFRGPHLRHFRDAESLERGVAETVRHEIAHHFGISDERLSEIERQRHGKSR